MRRRLPLTILAAFALVIAVTLVLRSTAWRDSADGAVADRPDSLATIDSTARARAAAAEEPSCVAGRIGLPCR